jgi:hypothetical protein
MWANPTVIRNISPAPTQSQAHAPGGGRNASPNFSQSSSAASGGLDFGDVDLAHFHHRGVGGFGFRAAGRQHRGLSGGGCGSWHSVITVPEGFFSRILPFLAGFQPNRFIFSLFRKVL